MKVSVNYKVTYNRLPEIIAMFPGAVSAVVKKTAMDIEADAKEDCPVSPGGGTLKNSIKAKTEEFSATVSPNTDYAAYVEFGTYKMGAQPYMRPAADKNEPKFVAAMEEIVKKL